MQLPYGFHGLLSKIDRPDIVPNTDNPAKWSHTCLLAERRSPGHATRTSLLGVTFNSRVQTMPFHWPVSYCFSEHTCRPSHTTKPRCAFVCTSRKISNTTDICLTAARGQMRVEFMRTRGSRARNFFFYACSG